MGPETKKKIQQKKRKKERKSKTKRERERARAEKSGRDVANMWGPTAEDVCMFLRGTLFIKIYRD